MRFLGVLLLSTVYLALSLGVDVRVHHCGDKIAWFQVNDIGKAGCCADLPPQKTGCCHDEEIVVQLDIDQQLSSIPVLNVQVPLQTNQLAIIQPLISKRVVAVPEFKDRGPPVESGKLLRLHSCSLVYYG